MNFVLTYLTLAIVFIVQASLGIYIDIILFACAGICEVADTPIKVVIATQSYQVIHVEHCLSQILDERGNEHGKIKQDPY